MENTKEKYLSKYDPGDRIIVDFQYSDFSKPFTEPEKCTLATALRRHFPGHEVSVGLLFAQLYVGGEGVRTLQIEGGFTLADRAAKRIKFLLHKIKLAKKPTVSLVFTN